MIPVTTRAGQALAVFGLGHTGRSAITALRAGGAKVWAWDDAPARRGDGAEAGAQIVPPEQFPWGTLDALVLSPGVPLTHPAPHRVVVLARQHNVPVIGDTELFVNELAGFPGVSLVAVTGTNGKSTTTALIGHLLSSAGRAVQVGGNIGDFAVLELKPFVNQVSYVIEFSSYQLDLTPSLVPRVAVFLNLSPDHLERHGGFENYARVKAKVFNAMQAEGTLVLGMDDPHTAAMQKHCPDGVAMVPISQDKIMPHGVYATGTQLFDATGGAPVLVADLAEMAGLRGLHNRQNAAAAVAVVRALGLEHGAIRQGLASFPGLAHRMQEVGRFKGVLAINDSKATNAEATAKALACFDTIFWIAGGRGKAGGISTLAPYFERISRAYLIGEAAEDFAATLQGEVDYRQCPTLDDAVAQALADAKAAQKAGAAPVVLLSPAAASFDQFANFEARGDAFCAALKRQ
ncbi:MAG: UDP-N-acetylmuramoyl-L-alanine--D-glutamate ligase [Alphaproteobacteria bacterium]